MLGKSASNIVLVLKEWPNKALQATPVNVAVFRANLVFVSRSTRSATLWGAPELERSVAFTSRTLRA